MRVYLPATLPLLAAWRAAGECGPAPLPACAVTPALRESYASGDAEELEYAATTAAAAASLRLLVAGPTGAAPRRGVVAAVGAAPRRVVVAADVADAAVRPGRDGHPATVTISEPVLWRSVTAVLADDAVAQATVARAVAALPAADAGDPDAVFAVEDVDGHELGWWATQEVDELLRGAGWPPRVGG